MSTDRYKALSEHGSDTADPICAEGNESRVLITVDCPEVGSGDIHGLANNLVKSLQGSLRELFREEVEPVNKGVAWKNILQGDGTMKSVPRVSLNFHTAHPQEALDCVARRVRELGGHSLVYEISSGGTLEL